MKSYFITGTDTNVGKTITSAILVQLLHANYWKPIQSGMPTEQDKIRELITIDDNRILKSNYSFKASLSPDQAAICEGISIDINSINLPSCNTPLIVEGAGGVYVPLNNNVCMLDLMYKLQLPIIIVTRGGLGTINHTLLTIQALRHKKLPIYGVIFNGDLNPDNQKAIEKWGKVKTLMHIPQFTQLNKANINHFIEEQMKSCLLDVIN